MSKIYLALIQGYTKTFRERGRSATLDILDKNNQLIRKNISTSNVSIRFECAKNTGNEYYEKGIIAYKQYDSTQLPSENELMSD